MRAFPPHSLCRHRVRTISSPTLWKRDIVSDILDSENWAQRIVSEGNQNHIQSLTRIVPPLYFLSVGRLPLRLKNLTNFLVSSLASPLEAAEKTISHIPLILSWDFRWYIISLFHIYFFDSSLLIGRTEKIFTSHSRSTFGYSAFPAYS